MQTAEALALARPTRLYVPVLLALLCGLRRGEITALRWRNVDLEGAQHEIEPLLLHQAGAHAEERGVRLDGEVVRLLQRGLVAAFSLRRRGVKVRAAANKP